MHVVDAVERHAVTAGSSTAVHCGEGSLTYAELAGRVDVLAHMLMRNGIERGQFVGVMLPRSADLVATLLAIMKVGAAYVPLDPLYPPDRCAHMLLDAGATSAVTLGAVSAHLAAALAHHRPEGCRPRLLELDSETVQGDMHGLAAAGPAGAAACGGDDLAYCIFTSGSTGKPKGVPIQHRALANLLESFQQQLSVTAESSLLALTTVCFDIAGLELFLPLLCGARLLLATRDQAADPEELTSLISRFQPAIMQATPTTWRMLLRSGWAGAHNMAALCGGEAMPQELQEELLPRVGRLVNCYGPTETTVWSTTWTARAGEKVQIGRPINNTTVHILDDRLRPVPEGETGTLWIGGIGLSPGYLNRADLNEKAFHVLEESGERIYCSGDLAYQQGDSLFCGGRIDHQIKLRGFRIEAEEVSTVLKRHPFVGDCCVDVKAEAEAQDSKHLVAYVVLRQPEEIRRMYSTPEVSSLAGHRLGPVCKASLARINSILDQSSTQAPDLLANDLQEVQAWGAVYDEAYSAQTSANSDPSLNFSGYDNSYTPRSPHQIPVVREWVETTCERIAALQPRRALEMGCGQGMIMLRCAKVARQLYVACDLSQFSVNYCRHILASDPRFELPHVVLDIAGAHEAEKYSKHELDTVICNGVSMYFPSADYLLEVVRSSVATVVAGGAFFLGDVRANTLFPHFHASTQLFQAGDSMPVRELVQKITHSMTFEKEFLVDPDLFLHVSHEIPDIAEVRLDMKRGHHHSEFSMFRYDVYFWREDPRKPRQLSTYGLTAYDPKRHSLKQLRAALTGPEAPRLLALAAVPDARTAADGQLVQLLRSPARRPETCGELRRMASALAAAQMPLEPEELYQLGSDLGYHVEMMWSPEDACAMDILFVEQGWQHTYETVAIAARRPSGAYPSGCRHKPWAHFTSKAIDASTALCAEDTAASTTTTTISDHSRASSLSAVSDTDSFAVTMSDVREWKAMLRLSVPEYMVPTVFMPLAALPLTQNGKLDRAALPQPTEAVVHLNHMRDPGTFVAPVGHTQTQLAVMWGELLHLADTSADDDFFEAGGHSLLAMQLTASVRELFGVHLSMASIAAHPRLDQLAEFIDSLAAGGQAQVQQGAARSGAQAVQQVRVQVVPPSHLPYESTLEVPHVAIPMEDGVELSAKLWLPGSAPPGIAIVEVNPYRKADGTAEIDALTFPYLAGHGLPCVRVDSRGAGDSQGILDDECSRQQTADAAAVVEWAAVQPWCDGRVVMLGLSWSGFIAMQVAAQPRPCAPLVAVVAVCATDSRYDDDMHYQGGALLCENLSWSSWLMHTLAMPPDPAAVGSAWKEQWAQRVQALEPRAPDWMRHSLDDEYWAVGSVKHVVSRITVPMLLVGGTHGGGYHNSVLRMARECVNASVQAVVGPWSHNMPHVSPLGPQRGFLQDVVAFVAGVARGEAADDVTLFSEAPSPARPMASAAAARCGRWLRFPSVSALDCIKEVTLPLLPDGVLGADPTAAAAAVCSVASVRSTLPEVHEGRPCVGLAGGRWFTFGANDDLPTDQAPEDALCATWDGPPAETDLLLLGRPVMQLALVDGATRSGVVVARLNAVAPNGVSHRVSWGSLHAAKAAADSPMLDVIMHDACYTLPRGYHLRLALSRDYFPLIWPELAPESLAPLPVRCVDSMLRVRLIPCTAAPATAALRLGSTVGHDGVHIPPGMAVRRARQHGGQRTAVCGPQGVQVTVEDRGGEAVLGSADNSLALATSCTESFLLAPLGDRLTAEHRIQRSTRIKRQGCLPIDVACNLEVHMIGTGNTARLVHQLSVVCDGTVTLQRSWQHDVNMDSHLCGA